MEYKDFTPEQRQKYEILKQKYTEASAILSDMYELLYPERLHLFSGSCRALERKILEVRDTLDLPELKAVRDQNMKEKTV